MAYIEAQGGSLADVERISQALIAANLTGQAYEDAMQVALIENAAMQGIAVPIAAMQETAATMQLVLPETLRQIRSLARGGSPEEFEVGMAGASESDRRNIGRNFALGAFSDQNQRYAQMGINFLADFAQIRGVNPEENMAAAQLALTQQMDAALKFGINVRNVSAAMASTVDSFFTETIANQTVQTYVLGSMNTAMERFTTALNGIDFEAIFGEDGSINQEVRNFFQNLFGLDDENLWWNVFTHPVVLTAMGVGIAGMFGAAAVVKATSMAVSGLVGVIGSLIGGALGTAGLRPTATPRPTGAANATTRPTGAANATTRPTGAATNAPRGSMFGRAAGFVARRAPLLGALAPDRMGDGTLQSLTNPILHGEGLEPGSVAWQMRERELASGNSTELFDYHSSGTLTPMMQQNQIDELRDELEFLRGEANPFTMMGQAIPPNISSRIAEIESILNGEIPGMATGGVALGSILANIGEGGSPEMVLPLDPALHDMAKYIAEQHVEIVGPMYRRLNNELIYRLFRENEEPIDRTFTKSLDKFFFSKETVENTIREIQDFYSSEDYVSGMELPENIRNSLAIMNAMGMRPNEFFQDYTRSDIASRGGSGSPSGYMPVAGGGGGSPSVPGARSGGSLGSNGSPITDVPGLPSSSYDNASREQIAADIYRAFREVGFSDSQARALTAEINRENSMRQSLIFGSHLDPYNRANNIGMLSWQGGRADNLAEFLRQRGLMTEDGRMVSSYENILAQAEFLRSEMENNSHGGSVDQNRRINQWMNTEDVTRDQSAVVLGDDFVRWRRTDPRYRDSGYGRISEGYSLLDRGLNLPSPSASIPSTGSETPSGSISSGHMKFVVEGDGNNTFLFNSGSIGHHTGSSPSHDGTHVDYSQGFRPVWVNNPRQSPVTVTDNTPGNPNQDSRNRENNRITILYQPVPIEMNGSIFYTTSDFVISQNTGRYVRISGSSGRHMASQIGATLPTAQQARAIELATTDRRTFRPAGVPNEYNLDSLIERSHDRSPPPTPSAPSGLTRGVGGVNGSPVGADARMIGFNFNQGDPSRGGLGLAVTRDGSVLSFGLGPDFNPDNPVIGPHSAIRSGGFTPIPPRQNRYDDDYPTVRGPTSDDVARMASYGYDHRDGQILDTDPDYDRNYYYGGTEQDQIDEERARRQQESLSYGGIIPSSSEHAGDFFLNYLHDHRSDQGIIRRANTQEEARLAQEREQLRSQLIGDPEEENRFIREQLERYFATREQATRARDEALWARTIADANRVLDAYERQMALEEAIRELDAQDALREQNALRDSDIEERARRQQESLSYGGIIGDSDIEESARRQQESLSYGGIDALMDSGISPPMMDFPVAGLPSSNDTLPDMFRDDSPNNIPQLSPLGVLGWGLGFEVVDTDVPPPPEPEPSTEIFSDEFVQALREGPAPLTPADQAAIDERGRNAQMRYAYEQAENAARAAGQPIPDRDEFYADWASQNAAPARPADDDNKSRRTDSGKRSPLRGIVGSIGEDLIESLHEVAEVMEEPLREAAEEMRGPMQQMAQEMRGPMEQMAQVMIPQMQQMMGSFPTDFLPAFSGILPQMQNFATEMLPVMQGAAQSMQPMLNTAMQDLSPLIGEMRRGMGGLADAFGRGPGFVIP
jgi:hypothetical protein